MSGLPPCLVLTAGLGTRLRPLTWLRAKPALPVAGTPLVVRILRGLAAAGVDRAVLNLHHLPDTIRAAVAEGAPPGLEIRYSLEDPILGSAGGPRRALPLLDSPRVLVVNGDTLTDVDPHAVVAAHGAAGALVTMAVVPNREPLRYGGVIVESDGAVSGFVPRGPAAVGSWHFIGVQALETEALAGVPVDRPSESVGGLYPRLIRDRPGSVRALRCEASFRDIGTPADYLATSVALAAGEARLLEGPRCAVASDAHVAGSILWEDVSVGSNARLVDCIVTDGARVGPGSNFSRRILMPASRAKALPAGSRGELADGLLAMAVGDERR